MVHHVLHFLSRKDWSNVILHDVEPNFALCMTVQRFNCKNLWYKIFLNFNLFERENILFKDLPVFLLFCLKKVVAIDFILILDIEFWINITCLSVVWTVRSFFLLMIKGAQSCRSLTKSQFLLPVVLLLVVVYWF